MTNPITVVKFGGSTFRSAEDYRRIAEYVLARRAEGPDVVVVTSGMVGATEELRGEALAIDPKVGVAALQGLLPIADTIGAARLRIALEAAGVPAELVTGERAGIRTEAVHVRPARVEFVDAQRVRELVERGVVPVVPGGQGVAVDGAPTWLGKNSSDLSAVLLAVALGAQACEIHSDVAFVHAADPRIVPSAPPLPKVSYDDMLAMATRGAKVLHPQAVAAARAADLPILCRLNDDDYRAGTVVGDYSPTRSVVVDLRSVVVEARDSASRDQVLWHLAAAGAQVHPVHDDDRALCFVAGGFFDVTAVLRTCPVEATVTGERVVTLIDGKVVSVAVADDDAAVARGAELLERDASAMDAGMRIGDRA